MKLKLSCIRGFFSHHFEVPPDDNQCMWMRSFILALISMLVSQIFVGKIYHWYNPDNIKMAILTSGNAMIKCFDDMNASLQSKVLVLTIIITQREIPIYTTHCKTC